MSRLIRRHSSCPSGDFWHRLRVGVAVGGLILIFAAL